MTRKLPFQYLLHRGVGKGATPFPGLLHFTLNTYLILLSVKQGGIKYHFLSLWYDSTWDWTPVSQTIGEHSTHSVKNLILHKYFKFPQDWSLAIRCSLVSYPGHSLGRGEGAGLILPQMCSWSILQIQPTRLFKWKRSEDVEQSLLKGGKVSFFSGKWFTFYLWNK